MTTLLPGQDMTPMADINLSQSAYAQTLESIAPGITNLVEQTQGENSTWYDSLARLLPALVATDQQRRLLAIQADRAAKGLPPLDVTQYGAGIQVGLDNGTKQLLMFGVIGIGAILFLGSRRRR